MVGGGGGGGGGGSQRLLCLNPTTVMVVLLLGLWLLLGCDNIQIDHTNNIYSISQSVKSLQPCLPQDET